jgi:hypothetical protein
MWNRIWQWASSNRICDGWNCSGEYLFSVLHLTPPLWSRGQSS